MRIARYKRFWGVYETSGDLLCVCVYKKGAQAVAERLTPATQTPPVSAPAPTARVRQGTAQTRKERYEARA